MSRISLSIDRIEGNRAVLIEGSGTRKFIVSRSHLPKDFNEGDWVSAEVSGDQLLSIQPDPQVTKVAEQRIAEKLAKPRGSGKK
jgi:hypothetical protein